MPGAIGNFFMKAMINSPLHSLLGDTFAVITVTGRKTGGAISTPINVSHEGDSYTVVSMRHRTWWRNLRGDAPASLRVSGRAFVVRGEIIEDTGEVREELRRYFQRYPDNARYFNVHLAPDGELHPDDLQHAAEDRLIIRLHPAGLVNKFVQVSNPPKGPFEQLDSTSKG
jgi:deazaflavin-dependent oxidoreductase (nitroreductase family)